MKSKNILMIVLTVFIIAPAFGVTGSDEKKTGDLSNKQEGMIELDNILKLIIGNNTLTATLVENSTTNALKEMLADGPMTIDMKDYGSMEKVGAFPRSLPRNDRQINTEAGDLILYQGNSFVIYYAPNSWNFTRIGKINDVTGKDLKNILGDGNVSVTLSMD